MEGKQTIIGKEGLSLKKVSQMAADVWPYAEEVVK